MGIKRFKNLSHLKYGKEITKSIGIKKFEKLISEDKNINIAIKECYKNIVFFKVDFMEY